jgi:ABC-type uncharacterized transport system involved in gliding motility auxiliary subunit
MKAMTLPIGIVLILLGVILAMFNTGQTPYPTYVLIAGVVVVAVYVLTNLQEMAKRSTMYGVNAILMSAFMVAILVVVYLIAQNRDKTWDLSTTGKYSLDNQTASILDNLQQPVKILLFYPTIQRAGGDFEQIKTLLDEYLKRSDKISYTLLDASKDYDTAVKYQTLLTSAMEPTLIAEIEVNGTPFREKAKGVKQEDISNAIKKVTHREAVTAYFLLGHNERELESQGPTGLAVLKQFLDEENVQASPQRLPASAEIPSNANIIALVGPEDDPSEAELAALKRFVLSGGSLFVALDPGTCPATVAMLKDLGIVVGENTVIEMEVGASSIEALLAGKMTARPSESVKSDKFSETHEITKDLGQSTVVFSQARTVDSVPSAPTGVQITKLIETKGDRLQGGGNLPNSWAESDPQALQSETATVENIFDPNRDKEGPVSLVIAAELDLDKVPNGSPDPANPTKKGKIVVAGDSDFLTNGGMSNRRSGGINRSHLDFALNIFNWMTGQVDLITIRQKEMDNTSVVLSAEDKSVIRNLLVILIPLILIPLIGICVGVYRRLRYV